MVQLYLPTSVWVYELTMSGCSKSRRSECDSPEVGSLVRVAEERVSCPVMGDGGKADEDA